MPTQQNDVAVGGLVDLYYTAESSFGSTPVSATFSKLRALRSGLTFGRDSYKSEERDSSRQRKSVRLGYHDVSGDIPGELSVQSWDDFIEAAMGGAWASGVATSVATVSVTVSGITGSAGTNFQSIGVKVGDIFTLRASNFASKRFQVASVGTTNLDIASDGGLVTTITSAALAVVGSKVSIGNAYRSFSILRHFTDLNLFQNFRGCRIQSMGWNVPATGLLGITFNVMGQTSDALTSTPVASALAAAATTEPMIAVNGSLFEGSTNTELGIVTGLTFNMGNAMDRTKVLGRNTSPHILFGRFAEMTGELTVLFNGAAYFNKFVNETESNVDFTVFTTSDEAAGSFIRVRLARIKYTGGNIDDGADTAIPITLPFEILKPLGTVSGEETSAVVIQRSN